MSCYTLTTHLLILLISSDLLECHYLGPPRYWTGGRSDGNIEYRHRHITSRPDKYFQWKRNILRAKYNTARHLLRPNIQLKRNFLNAKLKFGQDLFNAKRRVIQPIVDLKKRKINFLKNILRHKLNFLSSIFG